MPGSLWTGYLQAEQRALQEEELADEKKREKLEESLNQLRQTQLTREIKRTAEEWKYQQRLRKEKEQAISRLPPEIQDYVRLDLKLPSLPATKEKEPWWLGTPYEEEYKRKETYIKPDISGKEITVPQIGTALQTLYPKSEEYVEAGLPTTTADSLWTGLISEPRTPEEAPFFAGKQKLADLLMGLPGGVQAPQLPGLEEPRATEEGKPKNRMELLDLAKAQGVKKIKDRTGLKADLPWVTDEDIDWLESQL